MTNTEIRLAEAEMAVEWKDVVSKTGKLTIVTWFILLFYSWKEVYAPLFMLHAMTNLAGTPIYRYKEYKNRTYLLGPLPSPGFPGN